MLTAYCSSWIVHAWLKRSNKKKWAAAASLNVFFFLSVVVVSLMREVWDEATAKSILLNSCVFYLQVVTAKLSSIITKEQYLRKADLYLYIILSYEESSNSSSFDSHLIPDKLLPTQCVSCTIFAVPPGDTW